MEKLKGGVSFLPAEEMYIKINELVDSVNELQEALAPPDGAYVQQYIKRIDALEQRVAELEKFIGFFKLHKKIDAHLNNITYNSKKEERLFTREEILTLIESIKPKEITKEDLLCQGPIMDSDRAVGYNQGVNEFMRRIREVLNANNP